jgi:3-phenylpropionate/trans-cinnamate dioxygenase alpha subunit
MGLDGKVLDDWPGPGEAVSPYVTDRNFRNQWATWLRYMTDEV